jgi:hypothetical protein
MMMAGRSPNPPPLLVLRRTDRRPSRWGLVFLIVAAAAVMRLAGLGAIPASLFRDEAEKALTAWSLLHTGQDLEGRTTPLFVRAFGVTTSTVYQYAAIPGLAVLGPTDAAARLPAAVLGILAVVLVPWALRGFVSRPVALLAALALALSPWHVPMSRWAQQGIFLPVMFLVLVAGFHGLRRGRLGVFTLGMASGALAIFTYDPARLMVPLFLVVAVVLEWRSLRRYPWLALAGGVVLVLVSLPTVHLMFTQTEAAQARFRAISVFGLPPSEAVPTIFRNYLSHFSPDFLMFRGDREMRHGAGGVLGWGLGPGLWIGLITSVISRHRRQRRALLLAMVVLGPVAASLTREGIPHALRTLATAPFFVVLSVLGWADLFRLLGRRWFGGTIPPRMRLVALRLSVLGLGLNSLPFAANYFGPYARESAFSWQYGVKEGLETVAPALQAGVPVLGCSVVGGRLIGAWYLLQLVPEARQSRVIRTPMEEAPFGAVPADLDRSSPGLPRIYLAVPGLDPIPGGLRLPVWYQGVGSGDGKNPTLLEVHVNPTALGILRRGADNP